MGSAGALWEQLARRKPFRPWHLRPTTSTARAALRQGDKPPLQHGERLLARDRAICGGRPSGLAYDWETYGGDDAEPGLCLCG